MSPEVTGWLMIGAGLVLGFLLLRSVWPTNQHAQASGTTTVPRLPTTSGSPAGATPGRPLPPPAPRSREGTWASPGYRSARTRARWTQVLVGITAATYILEAIAHFSDLSLIDRIIGGSATDAEVTSFLSLWNSLDSMSVLAMAISAIAVLAWLSRMVEIVPPLGGGTPQRSPREAIGWWFVPLASLVIPYQIVRDVHDRLETPSRRGGDGIILAWWLLFIVGEAVVRGAAAATNGATTVDAFRADDVISIAALVATAVGGFLFVLVVGEIESRATERAVSRSLRSPDAVWPASGPHAGSSAVTAPTPSLIDGSPRALAAEIVRAPVPTPVTPAIASPVPPPAFASTNASIEARLATLERLRSSSTISDDEYTARRGKILDEI